MANWKTFVGAVTLLHLIVSGCVESTDHGISEITYVQPQRSIKCPSADEICDIQLTISNMQTLAAYNVSNGTRQSGAFAFKVDEQGNYDFMFPDQLENVTELFQPIVADGTTRRNLLVINDQLPGPTIIGYKNQRVRINVTNNLGKEAITLHWHGMHVNGSQYMDGVPFITQCPIQPSNSFLYDFYLFPGGTYWYHSHQYDERSNGLYGGLVVLDPADEDNTSKGYIDNPEEHTIAFFEWFPFNSDEYIEAPYSLPDPVNMSIPYKEVPTNDGTEAAFPPFFAGFMNFGGWRYNPSAADCIRAANISLPFFRNVSKGNNYRFRLVGSQVNYAYRFSIKGHRLRVVATDGIDATVPSSITDAVDFMIVHVGERYDFILEADQEVNNYLMLVETLEVPSELEKRGYCIKAHRGYAVLHYDGASEVLPDDFDDSYDPLTRCSSASDQCYAVNCPFENYPSNLNITCINIGQLELTTPEPVPDIDVSSSAFLNFGFGRGPSVNDRVFDFPPSPPISQLEDIPEDLFCQYSTFQSTIVPGNNEPSDGTAAPTIQPQPPFTCVHTYTVDTETVEMVYTNLGTRKILLGGSAHPIHLHGHHYRVMDVGYPTYFENGTVDTSTNAINCSLDGGICNVGAAWSPGYPRQSLCEINGTCPMKDTVIVPVGGYVRIRFPRDNWGWWIMHCHIEPHLLGGMAMVVNETSAEGNFPVPQNFQTCGNFGSMDISPATTDPSLPSTGAILSLSETTAYRNATIALAVISFFLLAALIATLIILIIVCISKKENKPIKVEVEMK